MEGKQAGRRERKQWGSRWALLPSPHLWVKCEIDSLTWNKCKTVAADTAVTSDLGEPRGKLASGKAGVASADPRLPLAV